MSAQVESSDLLLKASGGERAKLGAFFLLPFRPPVRLRPFERSSRSLTQRQQPVSQRQPREQTEGGGEKREEGNEEATPGDRGSSKKTGLEIRSGFFCPDRL